MAGLNTDDWAIVVGIQDYWAQKPKHRIPPLKGPINDAVCFHQWLGDLNGGAVPPGQIEVIHSTSSVPGTAPTLQRIEKAILRHVDDFEETQQRRRRLYLFVSGHGIVSGDADVEGCRILMGDACMRTLGRNLALAATGLVLQNSPLFEEIVVFADSCRELAPNPTAATPPQFLSAFEALKKQAIQQDKPTELMWGFATRWGRQAAETELPCCHDHAQRRYRGRFTHSLLDGLRRATGPTGAVTLRSLEPYVKRSMKDNYGDRQVPEFGGSDDIILARVPRAEDVRLAVTFSGGGPYDLAIEDGSLNSVTVHPVRPAPNVLEFSLPPGLYRFARSVDGVSVGESLLKAVQGEAVDVRL